MKDAGRFLFWLGLSFVVIGALLQFAPSLPWLGKLPGDIRIQRPGFTFVLPLALCLIYMYLVPTFWFRDPTASLLQFLSLEGISNMLRNRGMLLVAWTDLVIMDLVGAAWMTRKAAQIRMPYIYLLPCLLVGFVFIGYGFMLFAIIAAIGGGWSRIAEFEAQPPTNTVPAAARPDVAAEPA